MFCNLGTKYVYNRVTTQIDIVKHSKTHKKSSTNTSLFVFFLLEVSHLTLFTFILTYCAKFSVRIHRPKNFYVIFVFVLCPVFLFLWNIFFLGLSSRKTELKGYHLFMLSMLAVSCLRTACS